MADGVTVIINEKRYNLAGYDEEYLQRVASFINSQYAQAKTLDSYRSLDTASRNVLVELNLADEYFKLKKQFEDETYIGESKDKETFELKSEMAALKERCAKLEQENAAFREKLFEEEKKNIRTETELKEVRKQKSIQYVLPGMEVADGFDMMDDDGLEGYEGSSELSDAQNGPSPVGSYSIPRSFKGGSVYRGKHKKK